MSTDATDNPNKEEKVKHKLDYKRISVAFVDSIFSTIAPSTDKKDPLNSTSKEFYSKQPKNTKQEQLQTPSKQSPYPEQSIKSENPENPENTEKKPNSHYKNKKINEETSSTPTKTKNKNNHNNNNKQKKILYNNTSAKNINKSNKTLNNNDNNNKSNTRYFNKVKITYSPISDNFKAKIESEKEKKLYQEKVKLLENRINALKNHDEEIHRRMHCNEIRKTYLDQKKLEKNNMKQTLLSHDIDKRNELDNKRKEIKERKNSLNKHLKESIEKSKIIKMKDYENMQKEKKLALSIINENNNKLEKYGKRNVKKIQKQRENIKKNEMNKQKNMGQTVDNYYLETCEDNRNETNKLKNKLKVLEKLEIKYMNRLNKTRQSMLRNNSEGIYFYKKNMAPIKKLDLEKYINNRKMLKRKYKKTSSVDNLKNKYKVNENENDEKKE